MNFNVYLNKEMGEKVTKMAKHLHRSRNSIITEALEEWIQNHSKSKWPKDFFNFKAVEDFPSSKELRQDFKDISGDPLS